eukprot:768631-Hanusia_phi.AAC.1
MQQRQVVHMLHTDLKNILHLKSSRNQHTESDFCSLLSLVCQPSDVFATTGSCPIEQHCCLCGRQADEAGRDEELCKLLMSSPAVGRRRRACRTLNGEEVDEGSRDGDKDVDETTCRNDDQVDDQ